MREESPSYARAVNDPFSDRPAAQVLGRLVDAIGLHVFIAEVVGGVYREIYTGPGVEALMGGPVPPHIELDDAWPDRVHPDDWDVYSAAMDRIHGGEPGDVEYRMVGYDGVTRVIWERGRPWTAPDGRLVIDGFALDVTEQKRSEHELQVVMERLEAERAVADRRARIDSLTGVYNRSHLAEVIEIELERAVREGTTPGVFLIDLDHFKRVNDTYGHLPGDAVLVQAAARIRRSVRSYDCVARWGGEEFAVIVPVVSSDDALRSIGEGLRRAIAAEPFEADGALLSLTASVGCVRAGRDRWTADALVAAADRALYEAKDDGRNRTRTAHDAPSDSPATADAGIETIARALALAASIRDGRPDQPRPPRVGARRHGRLRAGPRPARLRPGQRRGAAGRRRADLDRRGRAHVADGRPGRPRRPRAGGRGRGAPRGRPAGRGRRAAAPARALRRLRRAGRPGGFATSRSRPASWPRPWSSRRPTTPRC